MAADERSMPFIKHLASSERKVRTEALTTLRTFLTASTTARTLSPLDYLKLWKGLFYALWMADRPIPQQNLCAELASLVGILPDDAVAPFLRAFWEIMSREWTSIDVLRMEKFLLLVRRVLGASFAWVRSDHNSNKKKNTTSGSGRSEVMLDLLREWPIEETGDLAKVSVGLRLHVLDIWVDEVERAGMTGEDATEADARFLAGVKAAVEKQIKSPSKPVRARAKEGLADDRLPWNESKAEGQEEEDDEEKDGWGGFDD